MATPTHHHAGDIDEHLIDAGLLQQHAAAAAAAARPGAQQRPKEPQDVARGLRHGPQSHVSCRKRANLYVLLQAKVTHRTARFSHCACPCGAAAIEHSAAAPVAIATTPAGPLHVAQVACYSNAKDTRYEITQP